MVDVNSIWKSSWESDDGPVIVKVEEILKRSDDGLDLCRCRILNKPIFGGTDGCIPLYLSSLEDYGYVQMVESVLSNFPEVL